MTAAAIIHTGVWWLIRNRNKQPVRAAAIPTMKGVRMLLVRAPASDATAATADIGIVTRPALELLKPAPASSH